INRIEPEGRFAQQRIRRLQPDLSKSGADVEKFTGFRISHPEDFVHVFGKLAKAFFAFFKSTRTMRERASALLDERKQFGFIGARLPHPEPIRAENERGDYEC